MSKGHQLAPDMRVRANNDPRAVPKSISDSRRVTQEGVFLETTRCLSNQSLKQKVQIQAIDRMRAIALERGEPAPRVLFNLRPHCSAPV